MDDTCFICESGDARALYRVCKCNTRAHRDCIEDVIRRVSTHSSHCPVCRTPYDISSRRVYTFRVVGRNAAELITAYAVTAFLLCVTSLMYTIGTDVCARTGLLCTATIGFTSATLSACGLTVVFHITNGRVCCLQRAMHQEEVSINLPTTVQL